MSEVQDCDTASYGVFRPHLASPSSQSDCQNIIYSELAVYPSRK